MYIYGNGKVGKKLHEILGAAGVDVLGHIISCGQIQIDSEIYIDEVNLSDDTVIAIGVGGKLITDIEKNLMERGIKEYYSLY